MKRRSFLDLAGLALLETVAGFPIPSAHARQIEGSMRQSSEKPHLMTLFLCGDVMTGRGIDQILPHPSNPILYESYLRDARDYVLLAERMNGPIPKPVAFPYIWGDALAEMESHAPDLRIVNLETSITTSNDYWPKGINYRMNPDNIGCLKAAAIDCCALANNHLLDWGHTGLVETLETLSASDIGYAGAGLNDDQATAPALLELPGKGRVLLFAFGAGSSGIPERWAASKTQSGINLLTDLSTRTVNRIAEAIHNYRRPGDTVVASIHWGGNWGYRIPREQRRFAHELIDKTGIHLIHGHSSHHPKGVEIYHGCPILYGCGDLINDYEGISGHEQYRSELGLMYFVSFNADSKKLAAIELTPTRMHRFKVNLASREEAKWLKHMLDSEGGPLGTHTVLHENNSLSLHWV